MNNQYLENKLLSYGMSQDYGFHMPGHKRQDKAAPFINGHFPLSSVDITEIPGFDDLHCPEGILKEEMERAAAFYGTCATIFSVNGSTASNLSALMAAVPFGGKLLMAANCHRSIPHAVRLGHFETGVLTPAEYAMDIPGPVTAKMVSDAFREKHYDAVILTSPTYEGVLSEVAKIAEVVHANDSILIVDEAHGAHLGRHHKLPYSAVEQGADLVIHSLHKTLPALTQTSLLHNVTGRVPTDRLMEEMDTFESSSPSYILMGSITSCFHRMMEEGSSMFDEYMELILESRRALGDLKHLKLFSAPFCEPSKIVIQTDGTALDGQQLSDILRKEYHLVMEKVMPHYALAMTSVCDSAEGLDRLVKALHEIDERLA